MKFLDEGEESISFSSRYPNFDVERFFIEQDLAWKVYDSADHREYAVNCPSCHERGEPTRDSHQKLWVNLEKGTYFCYRCQWSGSILKLVQKIANTSIPNTIKILRGSPLDVMEHMDLRLHIEQYQPDITMDTVLKDVDLPYGYEPIEGPHPYLEKRGIPWQYAAKYDWGHSVAGYTKNRIIVPTFMDGRLVFWQARATWDEPENKDFKKVLNPKGVSARGVLYNFDVAKKFEEVIIVEGFTDAVKTGPDAVATNGKRVHPEQLEFLQQAGVKSLVLAWDADAWTDEKVVKGKRKPSSIEAAVSLIHSFGFRVRGAKLPPKRDPGSFRYRSAKLRDFLAKAKAL